MWTPTLSNIENMRTFLHLDPVQIFQQHDQFTQLMLKQESLNTMFKDTFMEKSWTQFMMATHSSLSSLELNTWPLSSICTIKRLIQEIIWSLTMVSFQNFISQDTASKLPVSRRNTQASKRTTDHPLGTSIQDMTSLNIMSIWLEMKLTQK